MKKIIVAIDSFKGCLTSAEANQSAKEGILARMPDAEVIQIPVSDGGEGWLDAFQNAIGGLMVDVNVKDPLLRSIVAQYLIKDEMAVIEIAKASGLTLVAPEERNPIVATSYGTGQLIADAIRKGCNHIIVGLGGSATSDCGIGMLRAIIDAFDCNTWDEVTSLRDIKSALHFGYDRHNIPGAGAAGGLGYAFLQYMNAACCSGIDLLLNTIHFDELLKNASIVITGEGSADRQTLMGKLPYGILQKAKICDVPVILIAGRINDRQQLLEAGFSHVECINPPDLPIEDAMKPEIAKKNIKQISLRHSSYL